MTPQLHTQPRQLCPHLAAAVLWMSKPPRNTRKGKIRIRNARMYGRATDDFLAL